jgi:antitoxin VapB
VVEGWNVSLNIKNDEAHALAVQVARMTGESLTQAVTTALRERLARIERPDPLAEELLTLGRDCAARLKEPWRSLDHGGLLYDEQGLPR